jgi:hypothetical protein
MSKRSAALVASIVVLCLLPAAFSPVSAQIIYVHDSATGADNGTTWADAFTSLQSALAVAAVGDQIWVASGTYWPTATTSRTATFQLKNGVEVYGGFKGTEAALSDRNWNANLCFLSGDIGTAGVDTDNSYHVVTGSYTNSSAVLDGFRVADGRADVYPDHNGAGMYNESGSPTIRNVVFRDCYASHYGGGMYNTASSPILHFVDFLYNYSDTDGGGMYNYRASNPVLRQVIFDNNSAYGNGGGMYNNNSSPVLDVVFFRDNACDVATPALGGGMYNDEASNPQLSDVIFKANTAEHGGGMCNFGNSNPYLERVSFLENAAWRGGGIYSDGSSPTLFNVLFWANEAVGYNSLGGGMYNRGNMPVLINVTFSANIADDGSGGGMNNFNSGPQITNVILWGNSAVTAGDEINNVSSAPSIANSIIENSGGSGAAWDTGLGSDGGGNIDADPMFKNTAIGDLHIYSPSPAVEAGDNSALPGGTTIDLDHYPRVYGVFVDIGAYEVQGHPTGGEDDPLTPRESTIRSVYPNPFNPSAVIEFELAKRGEVRLGIYDTAGRLLRVLVEGTRAAGPHEVVWNGTDNAGGAVASGVYFVRFESGGKVVSKKIVLLR